MTADGNDKNSMASPEYKVLCDFIFIFLGAVDVGFSLTRTKHISVTGSFTKPVHFFYSCGIANPSCSNGRHPVGRYDHVLCEDVQEESAER